MEWTKERIRELRLRMGWSQSDLARHLEVSLPDLDLLELGADDQSHLEGIRSRLTLFWKQAESNSEEVQMAALAEKIIEDQNLTQIFQSDFKSKYIDFAEKG